MNTLNKILILGSGQAAIYAASEIRKYDKDSEISIFGNENYHPYERPVSYTHLTLPTKA